MKLALVSLAIAMAATTGCAGSRHSAAAPSVSTTTLTSATITPSTPSTPSTLAPAAWDDELPAPPPPVVPTWGSAITSSSTK